MAMAAMKLVKESLKINFNQTLTLDEKTKKVNQRVFSVLYICQPNWTTFNNMGW